MEYLCRYYTDSTASVCVGGGGECVHGESVGGAAVEAWPCDHGCTGSDKASQQQELTAAVITKEGEIHRFLQSYIYIFKYLWLFFIQSKIIGGSQIISHKDTSFTLVLFFLQEHSDGFIISPDVFICNNNVNCTSNTAEANALAL